MLGLGQIGGSVARAAAAAGMAVRAWTLSGVGPRAAEPDGIRSAATLEAAIAGADLVVLAAPALVCLELIDRLGDERPVGIRGDRGSLSSHTVVTDVVSTKVAIVDRARKAGLRFVGGHPMAGREATGYGASDPDLFRDRPWVLVPPDPADDDAEARVAELIATCGARPVRLTAAAHDAATALISHAPLVLSVALAEAAAARPEWPVAATLAAGGWAGMTRLAQGDAAMGAGILASNGGPTADALRTIRSTLDEWIALLEGGASADFLEDRLDSAADRLKNPS